MVGDKVICKVDEDGYQSFADIHFLPA